MDLLAEARVALEQDKLCLLVTADDPRPIESLVSRLVVEVERLRARLAKMEAALESYDPDPGGEALEPCGPECVICDARRGGYLALDTGKAYARREGAEAMREAAAKACVSRMEAHRGLVGYFREHGWAGSARHEEEVAHESGLCADAIRALPLPGDE